MSENKEVEADSPSIIENRILHLRMQATKISNLVIKLEGRLESILSPIKQGDEENKLENKPEETRSDITNQLNKISEILDGNIQRLKDDIIDRLEI